jgi:hypothetical protein
MNEMTRRTVLATGSVAAVGLIASNAVGQEVGAKPEDKGRLRALATSPVWRGPIFFSTLAEVVTYVNTAPAQHGGEVVVAPRSGGGYDVLVFF